jgi:hypothetical protein
VEEKARDTTVSIILRARPTNMDRGLGRCQLEKKGPIDEMATYVMLRNGDLKQDDATISHEQTKNVFLR